MPSTKRKRIEISPTQTENAKKKANNIAYTVPTHNQFNILDDSNDDTLSQPTEREAKPPPIFIDKVTNIRTLTKLLEETVEGLFEMKILCNDQVKIQPASREAYKTIVKELNAKGTEYYTYKPKQERSFRVVLKHMHPSTATEDIKEALAELGHTVINIWNMKQTSTMSPLHMFVIELQQNTSNKDIYKINSLLYCRVKFEPPRPKRTIPQCANCMAYGHTKSYCRRNPRCIKCAGNHASPDCSRKERSDDVKCVLCDGNHPTNYKGCTVYKELQKQKYPPLRIKPTQNKNKAETYIPPHSQKPRQNTSYADVVCTIPAQTKPKKAPAEPQKQSQAKMAPVFTQAQQSISEKKPQPQKESSVKQPQPLSLQQLHPQQTTCSSQSQSQQFTASL